MAFGIFSGLVGLLFRVIAGFLIGVRATTEANKEAK